MKVGDGEGANGLTYSHSQLNQQNIIYYSDILYTSFFN